MKWNLELTIGNENITEIFQFLIHPGILWKMCQKCQDDRRFNMQNACDLHRRSIVCSIFYRTQRAQVEQRNNNRILKAKYDYLSIWVSISDDYRAVSELVLL